MRGPAPAPGRARVRLSAAAPQRQDMKFYGQNCSLKKGEKEKKFEKSIMKKSLPLG